MQKSKKIIVLFSGQGGNLANLFEHLHQKQYGSISTQIVATVTNNPDALGIGISQKFGIEPSVIDHRLYKDRASFDEALVLYIKNYLPDIVVMAGFMRIVTPVFTSNVTAVNLHPSLLPKYKGANAIEQSFQSGDEECGVSVHYVQEALDSGAIILQKSFKRSKDETFESFTAKIKSLEYELLPLAVIKALTL